MKALDFEKISEKGTPIVPIGATGDAKSTLVTSLADDDETVRILTDRQANGHGTKIDTKIIATDYDAIPEKSVIISGDLPNISQYEILDDNEFIGTVLGLAVKNYNDKIDESSVQLKAFEVSEFIDKIEEKFYSCLLNPNNNSLEYHIKNLTDLDKKALIEILMRFDCKELRVLYLEAKRLYELETKKKSMKAYFTELLVKEIQVNDAMRTLVDEFWSTLTMCINSQIESLYNKISEFNIPSGINDTLEDIVDSRRHFTIKIDMNNKDTQVAKWLLNSEELSIESYIKNLTIYFRSNPFKTPDLFFDPKGYFTIFEDEATKKRYHAVQLIDTMGLFHIEGASVEEECERIIDILERYHSNNIIYMLSAHENATTKSSEECMMKFLNRCNKNVNVFICYSHFDEYVMECPKNTQLNMFKKDSNYSVKANLESKYQNLQLKTNKFISVIDKDKKKRANIINWVTTGLYCSNDDVNEYIDKHFILYPQAIEILLKRIAETNAGKSLRIRKSNNFDLHIQYDDSVKYDLSELYTNLVFCKSFCDNDSKIKPHWNTVVAVLDHWGNEGREFLSRAQGEDTGYAIIESYFVRYLRNFVNNSVLNLIRYTDNNGCIIGDSNEFIDELKEYMHKYLGREVAKSACERCLPHDSVRYLSNYSLLRQVLSTCRNEYFIATNVKINDDLKMLIDYSLKKCFRDFVNERCIEVY